MFVFNMTAYQLLKYCQEPCEKKKNLPKQYLKKFLPEACHVHQHDPWVDACFAVVWVAGETVVPANAWLLVLWSHGS